MILNPVTNRQVSLKGHTGKIIYRCLKKEDKITRDIVFRKLTKQKKNIARRLSPFPNKNLKKRK